MMESVEDSVTGGDRQSINLETHDVDLSVGVEELVVDEHLIRKAQKQVDVEQEEISMPRFVWQGRGASGQKCLSLVMVGLKLEEVKFQ